MAFKSNAESIRILVMRVFSLTLAIDINPRVDQFHYFFRRDVIFTSDVLNGLD